MPHAETEGQLPVEEDIEPDGDKTHRHRSPSAVESIKRGRKNLDARVGHQSRGIKLQRATRLQSVIQREFSALVNQPDDLVAQQNKPDGSRQGEEQREADRLGQRLAEVRHVAARGNLRNRRQGYRSHGHTENPERQLHQAEGVGQPAHRPVAEVGGEDAVDHDIDLHRAGSNHGRQHQPDNALHLRIAPAEIKMEGESDLFQTRDLHRELEETAHQRANGHADQCARTEGRINEPRHGHAAENRTQVVETRGQRGHAEDIARVEHAHDQRSQGHHENEGEHDARQFDGEGGLLRVEARSQHGNERGRENNAEQSHGGHEDQHQRGHLARQLPRRLVALLHPELGKNRDEGDRQRPLGKQIAQQIRRAVSRDVGVHPPPRAEQTREDQFARQTKHAAEHDGQRDDARRPGIELFLSHAPPCVADP